MSRSLLDPGQIIQGAYNEALTALKIQSIAGALVPEQYDYIALTYVPSGNGAGEIQTVTYKTGGSGGTQVALLTLAYDSSNNLISVTRT